MLENISKGISEELSKGISKILPDFSLIPITKENYMDVWDVYQSNNPYFLAAYGKDVHPNNILQTWERLVEGYDATQQLFFGLWQDATPIAPIAPIAVVELLPHFPEVGTLWLSEIIIHNNAKNQGLGTKIVQAITSAAKKDGQHSQIQLGIGNENPTAKAFWQKNGFTIIDTYEDMTTMQQLNF